MARGLVALMRGAFGDHQDQKKATFMSGPAGCHSRDFKAWRQHMSELLPTVEHGILSAILPKIIAKAKRDEAQQEGIEEIQEEPEDTAAVQQQLKEALEPVKEELMPPECDSKLIKGKVMAQSIAGGVDAEVVTARCLVKSAHVSPSCARCASDFLHVFMGRGMVGLASSCVPKCMPANNACKKGLTDQCLTKGAPCLKCLKPGLLELGNCVGLNGTRWGLSDKLDLFIKAFREGSTEPDKVDTFITNLVLALHA